MEQQKENWIRTLLSFAGPSKGKMILSVFCAILSVGGGFVPFWAVYEILILFIDQTVTLRDIQFWCLVGVAGYLVRVVCFGVSTILAHISAYTILEGLRLKIADRLMRAPLGEVMGRRIGYLKNIIMDNILPGDIYIRAKELHFATDAPRAVFLIRQVGHSDVATVDVLAGMFPDKMQDFVLSINESDVAVIKQITGGTTPEDLEKIAKSMEDTLKNELRIKTVIGIGTVSDHLRELADSYKEAQTAIDVGKVFDTEKSIIDYENLGIGRLIYQLPTTLCEIFLSEVFKKNSIDSLDQETLFTINKFFENNLNVSETSRKLFVHRNTLVYRLEKIKKLTGLDLRQFDHAIVFKVALMVRKYLTSRETR